MKNSITKAFLLGVGLLGLAATGWAADTSADVVASPDVPAASLDKAALKNILLGKTAYWDGGLSITIVVLTDKTDAALEDVTGLSAGGFKTYWQRLTFSGRGKQPKEADSIEKVLALVAENKGAVALVPVGTPLKDVKKIDVK